jgi:RNA-directed DNA polymerase
MKDSIRKALEDECSKLIDRHFEYLSFLDADVKRKSKKLGTHVSKLIKLPEYWAVEPRFHPFKVRPRIEFYADTLTKKIKQHRFEVNTSILHKVPKSDGTIRTVNVFQIADSAISRLVYKSLLAKNYARFSGYAYAYREDKIAYDAIKEISSDWRGKSRIYVAEFDYSKFFDNIRHDYIWQIFDRHGFVATPQEKKIVEAFLRCRSAETAEYSPTGGVERKVGIPQGTSISLFLANLVCFELDRELERLGVGFARYADDTLIWSANYSKVVEAFDKIENYGGLMGVPLNLDKSQGVHLLTTRGVEGEIQSKLSVDFLGHEISLEKIAIKAKHVERIKRKISFLIYQNLVQAPKKGTFNTARLGVDIDFDFVVALFQVRRYLYGGLSNGQLYAFLRGQIPTIHFKGLMSFYPLVNDDEQLSKLDGWLINTFKQALRLREKLWLSKGIAVLPGPKIGWINELEKFRKFNSATGKSFDLQLPSFRLINSAIDRAIQKTGLHGFYVLPSIYYD